MTDVSTQSMQQAVQTKTAEGFFRDSFSQIDNLPQKISALDRISQNFYWSWHPEGVELFRSLDPALWDVCEQTPRSLLTRVSELRMWQKAADDNYLARLKYFAEKFDAYVAQTAG